MESWVERALKRGYVRPVAEAKVDSGVLCDAATNPWYEDGVSFDWTALHKRLRGSDAYGRHAAVADITKQVAAFAESGAEQLRRGGSVMVTVVELQSPHWMQELSEDAQDRSVFSVAKGSGFNFFTFRRGPPGQVSVCLDVAAALSGVREQLASQGLSIHQFLSSFVLFGSDFDTLLHHTAAVHKALKGACGELNMHSSSLMPRRLSAVGGSWWAALPLEAITDPSDVALFATDLFFQWLADSYVWRCLPPVRVFCDAATTAATVEKQGLLLFERFVRKVVLPFTVPLGFPALKESLPEEGGDLWELAAPLLVRKRELVGPQKWTALDLRLCLGYLSAYSKDPSAVLHDS